MADEYRVKLDGNGGLWRLYKDIGAHPVTSERVYAEVMALEPLSIGGGGGGPSTDVNVTDRVGRLLGHVTVDNASLAVTGTFWQATQPVSGNWLTDAQLRAAAVPISAASLPLPSGAATDTSVTAVRDRLPAALTAGGRLKVAIEESMTIPVSGTFWQATQPVSGTFWQATQPVSGTFWQATQPVSGSWLTDAQLRATAVPVSGPLTDAQLRATAVPVSGTFWQATQPVSGTFWQATQPVSGTFWQATQPVSGTVTANQGTAGAGSWPIKGDVAHDAVNTTEILQTGGHAATDAPTAVAVGDRVRAWHGLHGEAKVSLARSWTNLGDYRAVTLALAHAAAADAATVGRWWLINPVGSGIAIAVHRVYFYHAITTAAAHLTIPRITLERVTFTGTASGAQITPSRRVRTTTQAQTADAAPIGSVRTASTGLTLAAGEIEHAALPPTALTGVGGVVNSYSVYGISERGEDALILAPGEGLVCRQADASATGRAWLNTIDWSEFTS